MGLSEMAACNPKYKQKTGELIAAKLLVYAGTGDEYQTFITPEAYHALKEWIDFRASYGEQITGDSWLMRNIWKTVGVKRSNNNLHNPDSNKDSRKRKNSCTGDNENFGYRCDGDATNPEKLQVKQSSTFCLELFTSKVFETI